MRLSDVAIKGTKPGTRTFRLSDGAGLYLEVTPQGSKLWRYRYRFNGKQKTLALGVYPDVSLARARELHQEARKQLAAGQDPMAARRARKMARAHSFGAVALEWWEAQRGRWSLKHAAIIKRRLELNVLPWLKDRPVNEISTAELLQVLRRVESRGVIHTTRRLSQYLNNIFIYAVSCGYVENNPAGSLVKALKTTRTRSFPAITKPKQIAELLRAIDGFTGTFVVGQALRFAPLAFVRPGELRKAEWQEFDLDGALWTIPAEKMKMKRDHLVPLSRQAVETLRELFPLTGDGRYVFPSVRTKARPMSENTLNVALRRLGYSKDEMVAHGFRTMASTHLHEMGWRSEVIEFQLAHADKNKIRGIYNRAEYLDERRRMMQAWADYLDSLKSGADVIPFRKIQE